MIVALGDPEPGACFLPKLRERDAQARQENPVGRDFSEALARGLRIIEAFNGQSGALSLSEIARLVDLPRATVRRSLLTLVQLGYIESGGKLFALSPRVLTLAMAYLNSSVAKSLLQPACERLALQFGETFAVAALDPPDAVMVAYARPRSLYLQQDAIGLRIPAHCTAVGRVLLANLPADDREAFFASHQIAPVTDRTVIDRSALADILDQVATQGHAIVEDEAELGFRSLAVPIRGTHGKARFALNVGMSVLRCPVERARETYVPVLEEEAARLSALLF
jgi:IclR family transcriptional regulator, pca regulon regulatory protein